MANTREMIKNLYRFAGIVDVPEAQLTADEKLSDRELISKIYHLKKLSTQEQLEMSETLKSAHLPDHLASVNGSEKIPTAMLEQGLRYYPKYENDDEKDPKDLHFASDCGVYHALLAEINLQVDKLKAINISPQESLTHFTTLFSHLNRLGRLYWTAGDIHACIILLDLSNYFATTPESNIATEKLVNDLQEKAIVYYKWATLLEHENESHALLEILPKSVVEEYEWSKQDEAQEVIFYGIDAAKRETLFYKAEKELKEMLEENTPGLRD